MNKRFGIQKLKKIAAANPSTNWHVAPTMHLSTLRHFPNQKFADAKRVVVRTDEAGKSYQHLNWYFMPRFDAIPKNNPKSTTREMRKKEAEHFNKATPPETYTTHRANYAKRRHYLLVPTHPREEIAYTGMATISAEHGKPEIRLYIHPTPGPQQTQHRNLLGAPFAKFEPHRGTLRRMPLTVSDMSLESFLSKATPKRKAQIRAIARNILSFIREGLETKQLKLRREYTEISFLTWKDAPTKLELFDLIEVRQVPQKDEY